jgi:hypothetical protein
MATASSRLAKEAGGTAGRRLSEKRRLIQQASAWLPKRHPQPARLQDLERSEAIRWVDLYGGALRDSEAHALLDPVCRGELNSQMMRDLVAPARYPATRRYGAGTVSITAAFRTRHLRRGAGLTSVFEPVHLLAGDGWLLSCWLPPRTYRGLAGDAIHSQRSADELYGAVAEAWFHDGGESAADLVETVHSELDAACGQAAPIH